MVTYSHGYEGMYAYALMDNAITSTGAVVSGSMFALEVGKTYKALEKRS